LKMVATRLRLGDISSRVSTHLVPVENSSVEKPVTLPPGCARLATRPWLSGSVTVKNTMGMERVPWSSALTGGVE
jgi:hypothetical protein